MTLSRSSLALALLAVAALSFACGRAETGPERPAASAENPAAEEAGVTYEPAYPTDVSEEGLSDEDVAQQETHAHGGEEHGHDDGDHAHDDGDHDDDHAHDDEDHEDDDHRH